MRDFPCRELTFEERLRQGFAACGFPLEAQHEKTPRKNETLILAVSGGPDSMALLTGVCGIVTQKKRIVVFTLDHAMRSESGQDALFVKEYCDSLNVVCKTARLTGGEVEKTARERRMGIEEAARFLRYQAFDSVLADSTPSVLCTAHTQDDNLETILMRFLQGASSLAGIPALRSRIIRPMLGIGKKDALEYLAARGVPFRVDSTNDDAAFLRNKIRIKLVPVLDECFPGWQKSLLNGAQKSRDDGAAVELLARTISWTKITRGGKAALSLPFDEFMKQPRAVRRELLYGAYNTLARAQESSSAVFNRLPYETVSRLCGGTFPARVHGVVFAQESLNIVIQTEEPDEGGFFALIEREGRYTVRGYTVTAGSQGRGVYARLPLCVRSPLAADAIAFAPGTKLLTRLFSSAKIPCALRQKIPVIETRAHGQSGIEAVMGSVAGYRDWISARAERLQQNSLGAKAHEQNGVVRVTVEEARDGAE